MRYLFTPTRMTIIKRTDNNKCSQGCEGWNPHARWWECEMVQRLWKTGADLKQSYPRNQHFHSSRCENMSVPKAYICTKTCTWMFTAAINISQNQKQSKCPLTDEWRNKMWHIHTMKYYSEIKRMKYRYKLQHG